MENYITIDKSLPLISNLNVIENIALIEEIHKHMSIEEAQNRALALLNKLSLGDIATKRINMCTPLEIFYTMFLRALMFDSNSIVIQYLFLLNDASEDIHTVVKNINLLNTQKNIIFIDTKNNENLYKDLPCPMNK